MDLFRFLRGVFGRSTTAKIQKADVPEVQAVIEDLLPILERFWRRKLDTIFAYVITLLSQYTETDGQDQVDVVWRAKSRGLTTEREVDMLVASIEERLACPLTTEEAVAVEDRARGLLSAAALSLGYLFITTSPLSYQVARRDLWLLLAGRIDAHREELRELLRQFLTDRQTRQAVLLSASQDLASLPDEIAIRATSWRTAFEGTLGSAWSTWGPPTVDVWAYRWYSMGRFLAGEQNGVRRWVAQNPLDARTTRFCRWVHGKVISSRRVRQQIRRYHSAVINGDVRRMRSIWSLSEPDRGVGRFRAFFQSSGLPPYHFFCRTIPVPA